MHIGGSPKPRRAKLTWTQWLAQPFAEDPDEYDDGGPCGDQEEPADRYDVGCLVTAGVMAVCWVCTVVLLAIALWR